MDVAELSDQIPAVSQQTWMNTGWSGPSPRSVIDALKDRIDMEGPLPLSMSPLQNLNET